MEFHFRQFHVEGFVVHYVLEPPTKPGTFVFISEAIENIPAGYRSRETHVVLGPDEFEEVFELAEPGKDFQIMVKNIDGALESLGWPTDYQFIDIDQLPETDAPHWLPNADGAVKGKDRPEYLCRHRRSPSRVDVCSWAEFRPSQRSPQPLPRRAPALRDSEKQRLGS